MFSLLEGSISRLASTVCYSRTAVRRSSHAANNDSSSATAAAAAAAANDNDDGAWCRFDRSFLHDDSLSELRKEVLFRLTLRETFLTPFPSSAAPNDSDDDDDDDDNAADDDFFGEREHLPDVAAFLSTHRQTAADILRLLGEHPETLRVHFDELVPSKVSYADFWQRFFYRCNENYIQRIWDAEDERDEIASKNAVLSRSLSNHAVIRNSSSRRDDPSSRQLLGREQLFSLLDAAAPQQELSTFLADWRQHDCGERPPSMSRSDSLSELSESTMTGGGGDGDDALDELSLEQEMEHVKRSVALKVSLELMQLPETYTTPLDELYDDDNSENDPCANFDDDVQDFLETFQLHQKTSEIAQLLQTHAVLREQFETLVPLHVSCEDFWTRFYFHCNEPRIALQLAAEEDHWRNVWTRAARVVRNGVVRAPWFLVRHLARGVVHTVFCDSQTHVMVEGNNDDGDESSATFSDTHSEDAEVEGGAEAQHLLSPVTTIKTVVSSFRDASSTGVKDMWRWKTFESSSARPLGRGGVRTCRRS